MKKKILKFISLTMVLTLFFSIGTSLTVEAKNGFNNKPTAKDGFVAGKNGQKTKVGSDYGWKDSKGRVWIPDGKMHGGKGWTRQYKDGSHDHVYPGGKIRSHNIRGSAGHKKNKINWALAAGLGLLSVIAIFTPIPGDEIIVGGALLGL